MCCACAVVASIARNATPETHLAYLAQPSYLNVSDVRLQESRVQVQATVMLPRRHGTAPSLSCEVCACNHAVRCQMCTSATHAAQYQIRTVLYDQYEAAIPGER